MTRFYVVISHSWVETPVSSWPDEETQDEAKDLEFVSQGSKELLYVDDSFSTYKHSPPVTLYRPVWGQDPAPPKPDSPPVWIRPSAWSVSPPEPGGSKGGSTGGTTSGETDGGAPGEGLQGFNSAHIRNGSATKDPSERVFPSSGKIRIWWCLRLFRA